MLCLDEHLEQLPELQVIKNLGISLGQALRLQQQAHNLHTVVSRYQLQG